MCYLSKNVNENAIIQFAFLYTCMGVYDMKMLKLFDISFLNLYPAVQWTIFKCLFKFKNENVV